MKDLKIFLADDDEDDRQFLKDSFASFIPSLEIVEALDGQDLIDHLNRQPDWNQLSLILLDMNMPRKNGLEVLSYIKANPMYHDNPVLMLSTTNDKDLIEQAYQLGAESFIAKPSKISEYDSIVQKIKIQFIDQGR